MSWPTTLSAWVTPSSTLPPDPLRNPQNVSIPPCSSPVVFLNFEDFVKTEAQALGYTLEQVRGWVPAARTRDGRGRRKA